MMKYVKLITETFLISTLTAQVFYIQKKNLSSDFILFCLKTSQSISALLIVRNTAAQNCYLFLELGNISSQMCFLLFLLILVF